MMQWRLAGAGFALTPFPITRSQPTKRCGVGSGSGGDSHSGSLESPPPVFYFWKRYVLIVIFIFIFIESKKNRYSQVCQWAESPPPNP